MPRRPRVSTAGLIFHVVNRAAKRARLFEESADYQAFERLLVAAVKRVDVALFAYCIMPNHWHLLLSPRVDGALSRFMHWLTTTHARRWQTRRGLDGQGAVYQGRFHAVAVRGDKHFLWVCRYVERNALRASLVTRAEDWHWSSLWQRQNHTETPWLAEWPVSCSIDWIAHVNEPQTDKEIESIRRSILNAQPIGDEEWRRDLMAFFGRYSRRGRGRPRKSIVAGVLEK